MNMATSENCKVTPLKAFAVWSFLSALRKLHPWRCQVFCSISWRALQPTGVEFRVASLGSSCASLKNEDDVPSSADLCNRHSQTAEALAASGRQVSRQENMRYSVSLLASS